MYPGVPRRSRDTALSHYLITLIILFVSHYDAYGEEICAARYRKI